MSIKSSTWTWCTLIYTTGVTKGMLILSKHLDWLVILYIQIHVLTIGSLSLYFGWLWFRLYFDWFWFSDVFVCRGLCFIKIRDVGFQLIVFHSPNTTHSRKGGYGHSCMIDAHIGVTLFEGGQFLVHRDSINFKLAWRSS